MRTFTTNQAKIRFGELLECAQRGPVRVMKHERVVGVLVSAQDYEAMRAFYANRLRQNLQLSAQSAFESGLTEDMLASLLDEIRT